MENPSFWVREGVWEIQFFPRKPKFFAQIFLGSDQRFSFLINENLGAGAGPLHYFRWRPYRAEYTGSLPNSEVNRRRARSVLGWGTAWEALRVPLTFSPCSVVLCCRFVFTGSGQPSSDGLWGGSSDLDEVPRVGSYVFTWVEKC